MLLPSFIQEVMAVEGEMRHSKMAEEPTDSASVSTMSLISVTNLRGTAFSWYVKGGSSGGFSPPLPGLNFLLSASAGEGVFLATSNIFQRDICMNLTVQVSRGVMKDDKS